MLNLKYKQIGNSKIHKRRLCRVHGSNLHNGSFRFVYTEKRKCKNLKPVKSRE